MYWALNAYFKYILKTHPYMDGGMNNILILLTFVNSEFSRLVNLTIS